MQEIYILQNLPFCQLKRFGDAKIAQVTPIKSKNDGKIIGFKGICEGEPVITLHAIRCLGIKVELLISG